MIFYEKRSLDCPSPILTVSPEAVSPVLGPHGPAVVAAVAGDAGAAGPGDPPGGPRAGLTRAVPTAGADPPPVPGLMIIMIVLYCKYINIITALYCQ